MRTVRDNPSPWTDEEEVAALVKRFRISDAEARFVIRSRRPDADPARDAEEYVALRDGGKTYDDFRRVQRELAERAAVREELRRQDLLDEERRQQEASNP